MSEQEVFNALKYRVEVAKDGTRRYYNNAGELHRDDGPAIEYPTAAKAGAKMENYIAPTDQLLSGPMAPRNGVKMANATALMGLPLSGQAGVKTGTSMAWK